MAKNLAVTLKYSLLLGIMALLGAGGYFLNSNPRDGASIFETEIGVKKGLKSKIKNIRLTEKLGKGDMWKLTATTASVNVSATEMENIKMTYFSAEKGPIKLSSRTGLLKTGTQDASFKGNVRVRSPKPLLLLTEQLEWSAGKRQFTTDKKVHIETGHAVINGVGLIINADSQDLTILNSVEATFN